MPGTKFKAKQDSPIQPMSRLARMAQPETRAPTPVGMTIDAAREYSESLGQIGQGWYRQILWAFDQRIPEALGMSRTEWRDHYYGPMRLPLPERREAVAELTDEGLSTRQIGDVLGVSAETVRRDLQPATNVAVHAKTMPPTGPVPATNVAPDPAEAAIVSDALAEIENAPSVVRSKLRVAHSKGHIEIDKYFALNPEAVVAVLDLDEQKWERHFLRRVRDGCDAWEKTLNQRAIRLMKTEEA